ncbi:MAG: methylmalonyl Co-A mutase-associated GTPase MeaB [Myxococcales bacterium]|nr:methylmalonyl Co-A mutase-associated GTPase MeaB [Myxococcales bacterium]
MADSQQALVAAIRRRELRPLARLLRDIDDNVPGADAMIRALWPHGGHAHIVGITGPPGAGKSTLVSGLISAWRARGKTVAVLAVDPSSPFSGGALLGDRVRMMHHATDPDVFIRSVATRGALGGLGPSTLEQVGVLDAAGFDIVIVETVGVGQDEVDIIRAAHSTVVVCVPGLGDAIQAMKAGVMEIADLFVVNKSDRPGAQTTVAELVRLGRMAPKADGWRVPVLRVVATTATGLEAVVDELQRHRTAGDGSDRSRARAIHAISQAKRRQHESALLPWLESSADGQALVHRVVTREMSPRDAADRCQ